MRLKDHIRLTWLAPSTIHAVEIRGDLSICPMVDNALKGNHDIRIFSSLVPFGFGCQGVHLVPMGHDPDICGSVILDGQ
jgi:hypothetical protein